METTLDYAPLEGDRHRHGKTVHSHPHRGPHRHGEEARGPDHDHHHHDHGHGHSHGLIDPSIKRSREGLRAVGLSLAVLGLTALAQVAIYLATGSVALLADLIHNFGDAATAPAPAAASTARPSSPTATTPAPTPTSASPWWPAPSSSPSACRSPTPSSASG